MTTWILSSTGFFLLIWRVISTYPFKKIIFMFYILGLCPFLVNLCMWCQIWSVVVAVFFCIELFRFVWIWKLDHKEVLVPENWCFKLWCWRRLFECPLDCRNIKPVSLKGNQPWTFIGRTDAETEAPILWTPDVKSQLVGKDPDSGKDWGQYEKGETEDKMAGWHHRLSGHEFKQTPGDSEEQGCLVSCWSWSHKESDTT